MNKQDEQRGAENNPSSNNAEFKLTGRVFERLATDFTLHGLQFLRHSWRNVVSLCAVLLECRHRREPLAAFGTALGPVRGECTFQSVLQQATLEVEAPFAPLARVGHDHILPPPPPPLGAIFLLFFLHFFLFLFLQVFSNLSR